MLLDSMHQVKRGNTHNRERKILKIWNEYMRELFDNEREKPTTHKNTEGPEILIGGKISTGQDKQEQSKRTR